MQSDWMQYGLAGLIALELTRVLRDGVKGLFAFLKARAEKRGDSGSSSNGSNGALLHEYREEQILSELSSNMTRQTAILEEMNRTTARIEDKIDDRWAS